ncbi:MAG TPA: hypothetical protein VD887_09930 [Allosphingosinicella sp.]|nr:hypothetical protein [Allosphingosinicella sp.]
MKTPLVTVGWPSTYFSGAARANLPKRMDHCTPDTKTAIEKVGAAVAAKGGKLYLSDLFRSYEMQAAAHDDFVKGRKSANSPPPGGSFHEAGRAFDLDLDALKMPLRDFWALAAPLGLVPIIDAPDSTKNESWHFECRGSHQLVYDYYKAGKGDNFGPKSGPYKAAAASAIVSIGVKVDKFGANQDAAYVQSGLIRLGADIGNMDAAIGKRTRDALTALGIAGSTLAEWVAGVGAALKAKFPREF